MILFRASLLMALIAGAVPAAVPLGSNLVFVRPSTLADAPPPPENPLVLDLRYTAVATPLPLDPWRAALAASGPLRIVLYDANPPEAVISLLAERHPNVLTVAPAGADPAPDFTVNVDAAADRAAYDALEAGAEVSALISDTREKHRLDEAALLRAHGNSAGARRTAQRLAANEPPAKEESPRRPTDALLHHAILLARGLQALGR